MKEQQQQQRYLLPASISRSIPKLRVFVLILILGVGIQTLWESKSLVSVDLFGVYEKSQGNDDQANETSGALATMSPNRTVTVVTLLETAKMQAKNTTPNSINDDVTTQHRNNNTYTGVSFPDQDIDQYTATTTRTTLISPEKTNHTDSSVTVAEGATSTMSPGNQSAMDSTSTAVLFTSAASATVSFLSSSFTWLLTNQTTPNSSSIGHQDTNSSSAEMYTKGVLDLLPWELQSLREYINNTGTRLLVGVCQTPNPAIQDTCCLGSFSGGGGVTRAWSHHCFKDEALYARVANTVLRDLQRTDHLVNEDCDLCRIVELVSKFNLKFAITGDSMMSQNIDGFFCELLRRGYHVTEVNTTSVNSNAMQGLKAVITYEISGPAHWQGPATVQFLFQYRPLLTEMHEIPPSYDVLMMNFGLHWTYDRIEAYKNDMADLLNVTRHHMNVTLLAHRETSAQHHNFTGGEWAATRTVCVPLNYQNDSHIIGWRERVFQAIAREAGYKVVVADETLSSAGPPPALGGSELVILPFFNVTASMFYLHPDECTHYCSTPYLWMPIWRGLRLAMDRQWDHRDA